MQKMKTVKILFEDIICICALVLIPCILLDKLGIYDSIKAIKNKRINEGDDNA